MLYIGICETCLLWFLWVKQQILLNTVWNYIIYSTLVIDLVISHSILSNMHIMAVPSSYLVTEMSSLDLYHLYIINSIVESGPSWGTSQTLISDNCDVPLSNYSHIDHPCRNSGSHQIIHNSSISWRSRLGKTVLKCTWKIKTKCFWYKFFQYCFNDTMSWISDSTCKGCTLLVWKLKGSPVCLHYPIHKVVKSSNY